MLKNSLIWIHARVLATVSLKVVSRRRKCTLLRVTTVSLIIRIYEKVIAKFRVVVGTRKS